MRSFHVNWLARGNHLGTLLLPPTIYFLHCNSLFLITGTLRPSFILLHNSLQTFQMASLRLIACGFLTCFMLLNPTAGRNCGGPFSGETSLTTDLIKMLRGRMLKGGGNHQLVAAEKGGNGRDMLNEELRMAPSGPDPLHHHGAVPKKPQLL